MTLLNLGVFASAQSAVSPALFEPSQISTGVWFDVADAETVHHTSNAVDTLDDKSGNSRHVGGTLTQRPTYDAAGGRIVFDGISNCLFNSLPFMSALDNKIVFLVANVTTGGNKNYVCESTSGGRGFYGPLRTGNSGTDQLDLCPIVVTDANANAIINRYMGAAIGGTKQIIKVYDNIGFFVAGVNGADASRMRSYERQDIVVTPNRFCIGAAWGASATLNGFAALDLYELIVVDNTEYADQIEGYLAHKHGLTSSLPAGHRYKSSPPYAGDSTDWNIKNIPGTFKDCLLGDSLTNHNGGSAGNVAEYSNAGNHDWYYYLSNGRSYRPLGNNLGVSGDQLSQIIARLPDLDNKDFDVCHVMGGTNGLTSETELNFRLNLDTVISYITLKLGKVCVLSTITAVEDADGTATPILLSKNAFIMRHHGACMGRVICVDACSPMLDESNVVLPNLLVDNVHYLPNGAYVVGKAKHDALLSIFGDAPLPDFSGTDNLLTNGQLNGTGGSGGDVADGWVFAESQPSPSTVSKDGDGHQLISSSYTSSSGDDFWEFYQTVTTGFDDGDLLYCVALIEADNVENIGELQLEMAMTPTTGLTNHTAIGSRARNGSIPQNVNGAVGQYLIMTPTIPCGADVTNIKVRIYQENDGAGVSTTSDVTIKGVGLFKR